MGFTFGIRSYAKTPSEPSEKTLRCPSGHELCSIISRGEQNCSCCIEGQFMGGTTVQGCQTCDWLVCECCYETRRVNAPNAPSDSKLSTPKNKQKNIVGFNSTGYTQIPMDQPNVKPSSFKRKISASKQKENADDDTPNLLTRTRKNIFQAAQQSPNEQMRKMSVTATPEHIIHEVDTILNSARGIRKTQRKNRLRSDYRSPSDYYYTPCRRRRYKRYSRWSDSFSSPLSEDLENTPISRPWRRRSRRRRRRREEYY